MKLERKNGIIINSREENGWESRATFNPAAIKEGDYVHILYRAVEGENISTVGYAKLDEAGNCIERRTDPVIRREKDYEKQGVEDPRVSCIDGVYYIIYTGYDGGDVRIVLAETTDFNTYKNCGIIGPDVWDKDGMLFDNKVSGKIALMHRIEPDVQIAFFDDIEHLKNPGKKYWENHLENLNSFVAMQRKYWWESAKVGGGVPPIKTDSGWLVIYHGVDDKSVYRAGAALLDLDNPLSVIARFPEPILEPETDYEKFGDVHNVVFPCGAALFDDLLYVYYGGADKVVGIACCSFEEILFELLKHKI